MTEDLLSTWEREAKEMKALIPEVNHQNSDRILALISMIRKKDEAFYNILSESYIAEDKNDHRSLVERIYEITNKALALTEQLK